MRLVSLWLSPSGAITPSAPMTQPLFPCKNVDHYTAKPHTPLLICPLFFKKMAYLYKKRAFLYIFEMHLLDFYNSLFYNEITPSKLQKGDNV